MKIITRGLGNNQLIITRGFGFRQIIQRLRREVIRLSSFICDKVDLCLSSSFNMKFNLSSSCVTLCISCASNISNALGLSSAFSKIKNLLSQVDLEDR